MFDQILSAFHITPTELLGEGGEAQVYALSEARIVRLFRMGANAADVAARTKLLAEIEAGAQHLTYETPIVLEQGEIFGRIYTIEKRIQGRSLLEALTDIHGNSRRHLIEQYMEAAWQLGSIRLKRPYFGEISRSDAIERATLVLTSDVFVRMVEKLDTFQPRGKPFAAWLVTIAHHRIVDHYRVADRRNVQQLSLELVDHAPLPDEQGAVRYDIERITYAMDNLTDLQRNVLALRFMGERTVKETADLLGRNEGAIKTLTRRAIAAGKLQLRREVRYE